ncbi:hypothetical protein MSAN_01699500 [Mycena sanguinolenta]|uniref:O-methyltransferase C-terminal domain-containing protein n=1 Tax=Mycena sanguinolenta TaxID=230812 RepID=A0A8H6XZ27_9AGAR|nr:hypothetical protein MSAN_01699500 [Mycena sanguinolenta]
MKSVAMLADTILDPKGGELGFNRAYGTTGSFFDWLHRPENVYQVQRFYVAMRGTAALESPDAIHKGFNWSGLPAGSVVVDVGGGTGQISLAIAWKNPSLRIVVQDLEDTIKNSKIYGNENLPSHVESRKVESQVHDFYTPQPVCSVIAQDWSEERFVKILRHLRDAAHPTTKLVVIDKILESAAGVPDSGEEAIPGSARPSAPAPLLPDWGVGKASVYYLDVSVSASVRKQEGRSLTVVIDAFLTGWS